ncbi:hypothetical protein B0H10DRAFT_1975607 [Mycena sp. CBHHK59/15]|nr:hypothetical protein B0H10DRAFT_1975607 [Mycena sp. CBHHK59/15]
MGRRRWYAPTLKRARTRHAAGGAQSEDTPSAPSPPSPPPAAHEPPTGRVCVAPSPFLAASRPPASILTFFQHASYRPPACIVLYGGADSPLRAHRHPHTTPHKEKYRPTSKGLLKGLRGLSHWSGIFLPIGKSSEPFPEPFRPRSIFFFLGCARAAHWYAQHRPSARAANGSDGSDDTPAHAATDVGRPCGSDLTGCGARVFRYLSEAVEVRVVVLPRAGAGLGVNGRGLVRRRRFTQGGARIWRRYPLHGRNPASASPVGRSVVRAHHMRRISTAFRPRLLDDVADRRAKCGRRAGPAGGEALWASTSLFTVVLVGFCSLYFRHATSRPLLRGEQRSHKLRAPSQSSSVRPIV